MKATDDTSAAHLFLDDTGIEETTRVQRVWHPLRRQSEPVIVGDRPWEQHCASAYGTVLDWRGKLRMWYVAFSRHAKPRVCYAESDDGIAWTKPSLGACEWEGSRDNNIVLDASDPKAFIDDCTVIDDPDDREWPLKMLYWQAVEHDWTKNDWGIFAARSGDGIHWDRSPGLVLPQWIDRFNAVSTKVDGKYVVFGRSADLQRGMIRNGRSVWRTESADLVHWSAPQRVLERDAEDPVLMEYYSAVAFPYEGLMLGGLERMYMSPDKLDCELIWSRDAGRTWYRARNRPAFIEPLPAPRWDDTWTMLPTNAPIIRDERLWFYYSARSAAHAPSYAINRGAMGVATLRIDGFASIRAGETSGHVVTRPVKWPHDSALHVNVDPRRDLTSHPGFCSGEVRVELRSEANEPIKGFTFEEADPLTQNTVSLPNASRPATWRGHPVPKEIAAAPTRIAFRLRDAHLYSFRFAPRKD